jgi:hypothetical protein
VCSKHDNTLKISEKFQSAGSITDRRGTRTRHVLADEKLDEMGAVKVSGSGKMREVFVRYL